ncbi:hypothetical protein CROQUDRAFT_36277, partial [Cronartium quercuum f. sp. fusiforme G11]
LVTSLNLKTREISALWEQELTFCKSWGEHSSIEFHFLTVHLSPQRPTNL